MVIVFEGCDLVNKTKIATELSKRCGIKLLKTDYIDIMKLKNHSLIYINKKYDFSYICSDFKPIIVYVTINLRRLQKIEDKTIKEQHQAYDEFFDNYQGYVIKVDGNKKLHTNVNYIGHQIFVRRLPNQK